MKRRIGALVVLIVFASACRMVPATPTLAPPTPTATQSTPTLPPVPTPSVPVFLPEQCTLDRTLEILGSFLTALGAGDTAALRELLDSSTGALQEAQVFAVVPREPDVLTTGLYTEQMDAFLDWAAARAAAEERWTVLELLRFTPSTADRVRLTLALLREARDFIAKPLVGMVDLDCRSGKIVSFVAGAMGAEALPAEPQELLASALGQRPARLPDDPSSCPRSAWAIGNMIGTGPVFLGLGPDGIVNLGDATVGHATTVTARLLVAASERGPLTIRLFRLPDPTALPFADGRTIIVIPPSQHGVRTEAIPLALSQAGCYVLQADGATWQTQIVFEVVPESVAALVPELSGADLPVQLRVVSAVRDGPESVRVGLVGPTLVARLSIGMGGPGEPALGPEARCQLSPGRGELCWVPHPVWGWPQTAVWEDGVRRYQLVVLAGNRDAWTEEELIALVDQLRRGGASTYPSARPTRVNEP